MTATDTIPPVVDGEPPMPCRFSPNEGARFGRLLADALLFAGTDAMRPALYGVQIEVLADGTVQMVATNSYVLAWIRDDEGVALPSNISYVAGGDRPKPEPMKVVRDPFPPTVYERDGLAAIAKQLTRLKPDERVEITLDAEALVVSDARFAGGSEWTLRARAVDVQFPPSWSTLVPELDAEPEALPTPTINVVHLALLGKLTLGRRVRKGESFGLNYRGFGDKKPAAVTGTAPGVELVALIMPVR